VLVYQKNGGGSPEMIRYICSYFFDKPTHLNSIYWRALNRTVEFWTNDDIDGKKMADIPLFVLTSHYTFSGAEEFTYNMQTQKRATIIGEITGGGANPGGMVPVDKLFSVFIPNGRAINPVTGTNWEGIGVKPDIEVPEDKAYDIALEKAKASAGKYSENKKKEITQKWTIVKEKITAAEKLFITSENNEGEKQLNDALNNALNAGFINESFINNMGYDYLNKKNNPMAIAVFKFNTKAFPKSENTWDSLAEAYMNSGEKEMAIEYYKKSIELNPDNTNAKENIKKMEGK
jgi:tetratricopeptide (TPR) repeat protein